MNEEAESAIVQAAQDYQNRLLLDGLPQAVLPDWMWDKMPEGYAEDFKRRTSITLRRYDD